MKTSLTYVDIPLDSFPVQTVIDAESNTLDPQQTAVRSISVLQTTAPKTYAHLQKMLSIQDAQIVISIPTHLIKISEFSNRHIDSYSSAAFIALKNEIRNAGGNSQPILVRPITTNKNQVTSGDLYEGALYEIISGQRRFQCCRELGLTVKAIVAPEITDGELVISMHRENTARAPLAPWEYGVMLKSWLDKKLFKSLRDISRSIGSDLSGISRAIALADLPEIIVESFESPLQLQFKDADLINQLLVKNSVAVKLIAQDLANTSPKLSRTVVLKKLTQACDEVADVGSSNTPRKDDIRVGSQVIGSIVWDSKGQARVVIKQPVSETGQHELQALIAKFLERDSRIKPVRNRDQLDLVI